MKREKELSSAPDKLILPAGVVHAEGEDERMVYIVGISKPNLFDALLPLPEPIRVPN